MSARRTRLTWLVAAFATLLLLAAVAASAARPRAGIDRSYGEGGVVAVQLPSSPDGYLVDTLFATAPDGSAYQLNAFRSCARSGEGCSTVEALYRWKPGGAFDASFGHGGFQSVAVSAPDGAVGALTVDSRGRPLVGVLESGRVVVRRFSASGTPDASFGAGGSTSIPCPAGCDRAQLWLLAAPRGRAVVEVQTTRPPIEGSLGSALGGRVALTRLTPGGRPERHFGAGGTVTIKLGLRGYPGKAVVTAGGGVLLGAIGCCAGNAPYLLRLSRKGRVDTRFGRAAGRSLARLARRGEVAAVVALLPRANGGIELVGNDALQGGFDLRLKANGDRARFGKGGLRRLPFTVEAAARGARGAIFALGAHGTGPFSAFRVLADGRVDPAFGRRGIAVPLSGGGVTLGTPVHGRVLVFDRGYHTCRSGCASTPGIARFDEGARKG